MIVVCPLCQTHYLVAADIFGAGPRQVRCGRCAHEWQGHNPEEVIEDRAPPLPLPTSGPVRKPFARGAMPLMRHITPPPRFQRYIRIGVPSAFGALLLLWFFLDKQDIALAWPPMEHVYNTVGLTIHHYGEGVVFANVRSELRYDSGIMKLVVEGKLDNGTPYVQEIPNILASAIGSDGEVMQSWQIDAPAVKVQPGQAVPFQSSINAPRGTVADVTLKFNGMPHAEDRQSP